MTIVMILTLTIFLFQAQSVFLLLFGVISTNILPGDKHNQIHFPPNPDGRETPHIDWRLAVADISTGLNCVLMAWREDRGRPGRERETLLSCTNNTRDICRSSSSSSSSSYITEFRPVRVEVRVGPSQWSLVLLSNVCHKDTTQGSRSTLLLAFLAFHCVFKAWW